MVHHFSLSFDCWHGLKHPLDGLPPPRVLLSVHVVVLIPFSVRLSFVRGAFSVFGLGGVRKSSVESDKFTVEEEFIYEPLVEAGLLGSGWALAAPGELYGGV